MRFAVLLLAALLPIAAVAADTTTPRTAHPLKIGIIGSMAVCTLIYMLVAISAVSAVNHRELAASGEPLAYVLRMLNHPGAAWAVGLAALIALPSVILVMMLGQPRIFYAMSKDGLLPPIFSDVHPRFRTPWLGNAHPRAFSG